MKLLTTELIIQQPNLMVEYNHSDNWLYVSWCGFQPYDVVIDSCEKVLDAVLETRCSRMLNDNTHIEGIWSGAAKWVALDWFPRMQAAGLERFAWVYPPSTFSRLSADRALQFMDDQSFIRTFNDIEAASDWLRAC